MEIIFTMHGILKPEGTKSIRFIYFRFHGKDARMIHELVIALMLGLIGGVIPGPVITAVFTEILQSGYLKSLRIIMIALVTETLVALISLLILDSLGFNETFFRGLSLAGAVILIWIAISIWKVRSLDSGEKVQFGLWKVVVMILSNGVLWTYWITICIPKAILLGDTVHLESERIELKETSNPKWGKEIARESLINQKGELVCQADIIHLYERKPK